MKLTIDTEAKTIAMEEAITLDALTKLVKKLFPESWKEWKLIGATQGIWVYPTDPGPLTIYSDPAIMPIPNPLPGTGDPMPELFHTTCVLN